MLSLRVKTANGWYNIVAGNLKQLIEMVFIFGHRHMPLDISLNDQSKYYNLGDWISYYTYGQFDGTTFSLNIFK